MGKRNCAVWTEEELAVLAHLKDTREPISKHLHKFQGRTRSSVGIKLLRLYGKREVIPHYVSSGYFDAIADCLEGSEGLTSKEISDRTGISHYSVRTILVSKERPPGLYICGWTRGSNGGTRQMAIFNFKEGFDCRNDVHHPRASPPKRIRRPKVKRPQEMPVQDNELRIVPQIHSFWIGNNNATKHI